MLEPAQSRRVSPKPFGMYWLLQHDLEIQSGMYQQNSEKSSVRGKVFKKQLDTCLGLL